jgi:hypothetical protein
MRSVISSVLVAACAVLLTGCAGGSSPTTSSTPAAESVSPPGAAAGETVIASVKGQGSSRSARDITTDGSYTAYLVCRGGQEVVVASTASGSDTPIPCTGHVSRVRYLTDGHADSLTVRAAAGQTWGLTVADAALSG